MLRSASEDNVSIPASYQKRHSRAALHNVAVIPSAGRSQGRRVAQAIASSYRNKQKRLRSFQVAEPLVLLRQNYYGLGAGVGFCPF